jgi:hypothetical protein
LVLLIPNSYTIPIWEFYFLPFSVHVQINVIYISHKNEWRYNSASPYAFMACTGMTSTV